MLRFLTVKNKMKARHLNKHCRLFFCLAFIGWLATLLLGLGAFSSVQAKEGGYLTLNQVQLEQRQYKFPTVTLSADEIKAINLAAQGKYKKARALINKDKKHMEDLLIWLAATSGRTDLDYDVVEGLLKTTNEWPQGYALNNYLESHLPVFKNDRDIIALFDQNFPNTFDGVSRYLDALKRKGKEEQYLDIAKRWWQTKVTSRDDQRTFLKRYKKVLDEQDHINRLQTLLAPGAYHYTLARALSKYIGGIWPVYTEARIALQNPGRAMNVDGWLSQLREKAPEMINDPYLARDRFYWHKEQERPENDLRALKVLQAVPEWPDFIPRSRGWWQQQRIVVNRFIAQNKYDEAFQLASINVFDGGEEEADLNFIAGWVALQKLNAPNRAVLHFTKMSQIVSTANSSSQAYYWLGRAYKGAGDKEQAGYYFAKASQFPYNFYGQLAAEEKLCKPSEDLKKSPNGQSKLSKDLARSKALEPFMYIYQYLLKADRDIAAYGFIRKLATLASTRADYQYLSDYALFLNNQFHSLLIAKLGYNLDYHQMGISAFPVLHLDVIDGMKLKALVHAVIRQESGFNPQAVSRVGALGLTQLMPFVASKEASRNNLPYRKSRLLSDPAYSVRLGESHLKHLLKVNKGHHIMRVLAGYNAGMARVREWIGVYGDPGSREVNPIEWMESLPYGETRDYVRKVLENYVIYNKIFSHKNSNLDYINICN